MKKLILKSEFSKFLKKVHLKECTNLDELEEIRISKSWPGQSAIIEKTELTRYFKLVFLASLILGPEEQKRFSIENRWHMYVSTLKL